MIEVTGMKLMGEGFYPGLWRRRKLSQVLESVRIESCGDKVHQIQLLARVSNLNAEAALGLHSGGIIFYPFPLRIESHKRLQSAHP